MQATKRQKPLSKPLCANYKLIISICYSFTSLFGDYYGSYRAMEEAYKEGKVRAIGVSNFYADRYLDLAYHCEIKPAVNQMETTCILPTARPPRANEEIRYQANVVGTFC